jgi:hypothetical protein
MQRGARFVHPRTPVQRDSFHREQGEGDRGQGTGDRLAHLMAIVPPENQRIRADFGPAVPSLSPVPYPLFPISSVA